MAFPAPSPSIWVGGLDPSISEQKLYDHFIRIGPVVSVRVCSDSTTLKSLGYGYVNFQDPSDAEKALDLAGTKLGSKYLRIARIQRDPAKRRAGVANIVVKKIPQGIDNAALKEMFAKFGRLNTVILPIDQETKEHRGYARLSYENEEDAVAAVKEMDGTEFDGQAIVVERYQPQYRDEHLKQFTNLYVKNLKPTVTDEQLKALFSKYGEVTSCKVRDLGPDVKAEVGFAYVAYADHEAAAKAVEELNGKKIDLSLDDKELEVSRFRSRAERERERETLRRERAQQHSKYPNLYVKGFDDTVTSERLRELFDTIGETVSVTVMKDRDSGLSRCFGFVSMKTQDAAAKAIHELNGSSFLCPRPLFVTYALRKDARRQNLEERSRQNQMRMRQPGPMGGVMPPMGFPNQGPMFNMNMPYNMNRGMPMMPGMPPNMGPMRAPMVSAPMNQMRSRVPMMQQPQRPHLQHAMPMQPRPAAPINPEEQKNVLGERLYHYIQSRHANVNASKITGMLLEMEPADIMNMLENTPLLDAKVEEAQEVLNRHMT